MTTYDLKCYFEEKKSWLEREYQKELDRLASTLEEPIPKFISEADPDAYRDNEEDR